MRRRRNILVSVVISTAVVCLALGCYTEHKVRVVFGSEDSAGPAATQPAGPSEPMEEFPW